MFGAFYFGQPYFGQGNWEEYPDGDFLYLESIITTTINKNSTLVVTLNMDSQITTTLNFISTIL